MITLWGCSQFEKLNRLNNNVFELGWTVLTLVYINNDYDEPQIDLLLYKDQNCSITKIHCLSKKDSQMKQVCRRCLTAFRSQLILSDHIDRCQKQKPTNIKFSSKNILKFEDYYMKVTITIRVNVDFERINQPQNDPDQPKVLFKQGPIAVGFYLISPWENTYYSYFGEDCVNW